MSGIAVGSGLENVRVTGAVWARADPAKIPMVQRATAKIATLASNIAFLGVPAIILVFFVPVICIRPYTPTV